MPVMLMFVMPVMRGLGVLAGHGTAYKLLSNCKNLLATVQRMVHQLDGGGGG